MIMKVYPFQSLFYSSHELPSQWILGLACRFTHLRHVQYGVDFATFTCIHDPESPAAGRDWIDLDQSIISNIRWRILAQNHKCKIVSWHQT